MFRKSFSEQLKQVPVVISSLNPENPLVARGRKAGLGSVQGICVKSRYYYPIDIDGSPCGKVLGNLGSFSTHLSWVHKDAKAKPTPKERE
jgi:hypothetical protein